MHPNAADALQLYEIILRNSNKFLHNCKNLPIQFLKEEKPSWPELAAIMRRIGAIIVELADAFDPMMGQKAHEYCELMTAMGVAIENDDHIELQRLVGELERRPGV